MSYKVNDVINKKKYEFDTFEKASQKAFEIRNSIKDSYVVIIGNKFCIEKRK